MHPDRRLRQAAAGILLGLGLAVAASPLIAQTRIDASVLAGSCANCHGTDGRSPGIVASLAGRPEAELAAKLKAFRSATPPPNTTVMGRIAKGYSEAELDALAKHFAQLKARGPQAAMTKGGKQ
jgi:sulfide dehydrogenase cytochrome subunit